MFKYFTAQNLNGEVYTALDFSQGKAYLYTAPEGDISLIRRFIQLAWASTAEDGTGAALTLSTQDHKITSTLDNIYYDDKPVKINDMESIYGVKFSEYSKLFVLTYTQLLNLELSRIPAFNYLNQYVFKKPDSKSYYSPLEDIFYDIEQAKKYASQMTESTGEEPVNKEAKVKEIQNKINELERQEADPQKKIIGKTVEEQIFNLETELNNQKAQDELSSTKENLENKLYELDEHIKNYDQQMKKVSKVDMDISKYQKFSKLKPERVESDLGAFAYRLREREKVLSDLANSKVKYAAPTTHFTILPILLLIIFSGSVGITLAIVANVFIGLILGLIGCAFAVVYFILKKDTPAEDPTIITQEQIAAISNEIEALRSARIRYLNNLGFQNEDDYFATKALTRALLYEKEKDLSNLHEQFSGKELSDFKLEKINIENNLKNIHHQVQSLGAALSPEEYIKKRRDLDILKLELSSQTSETPSIDLESQIKKLQEELQTLMQENHSTDAKDIFIQILRDYYGISDITVTDDYIVEGINISDYTEKVGLFILQRIAYIKSLHPNVELPLFMEDPFIGVDDMERIQKIIDFCAEKLQVILITEHDKYSSLGFKAIGESINDQNQD